MDKFRKFCVILFGGLSLFFAILAIHNHFFYNAKKYYQYKATEWNLNLANNATTNDKLIFFFVSGNEIISRKIKKTLEENYVFSILDKEKNSADYEVFNYFLKKNSKTKQDLACAILTPNFKPIYLSGKVEKKRLEKILTAIANSYKNNKGLIRSKAELVSIQQVRNSQSIFFTNMPIFNFVYSVTPSRFDQNTPTAVVTENARVAFKNYKKYPSPVQKFRAEKSLSALKTRYKRASNKTEKLLIARAIADIAFATNVRNINELKQEADSIISSRNSSKSTLISALELAVLSRAYAVFATEDYAKKAEALTTYLENTLFNAQETSIQFLPTSLEANSIQTNSNVSALDLAVMANALCDFYEITFDKRHLFSALEIIKKLDAEYSHKGFWTINSKYCPSANFARITIINDSDKPSHLGEAYQAISRINRGLNISTISPSQYNKYKISTRFIPALEHSRASIKLAEM